MSASSHWRISSPRPGSARGEPVLPIPWGARAGGGGGWILGWEAGKTGAAPQPCGMGAARCVHYGHGYKGRRAPCRGGCRRQGGAAQPCGMGAARCARHDEQY